MQDSRFDTQIERAGTGALALAYDRFDIPAGALPLWVADMAFAPPQPVLQALQERVASGAMGYTLATDAYFDALGGWFSRRHGWNVDPHTAIRTRGIVHALHLALETLSKPGDGVLIQPPVYTPFFEVIEATGRQLLTSQLLETDSGWEIDFDDFEAKARNARIFILCSPHNPVGRVWRRSELEQLAAICLRHNVKIVSDEIHADFVYPGSKHTVTATLSDEVNAATVTCTAPSKTFNLAGLQLANVFAADAATRHGMAAAFHGQGLSHTPALGLLACQVAYSGACDEWVDALVRYLDTTMALIESEVAQRLAPSVAFHRPEGTYLTWLDLRKLGLTIPEARQLVVERAGLWLSEGSAFGPGGDGYWRLNAAFARATVRDALDRLAQALG